MRAFIAPGHDSDQPVLHDDRCAANSAHLERHGYFKLHIHCAFGASETSVDKRWLSLIRGREVRLPLRFGERESGAYQIWWQIKRDLRSQLENRKIKILIRSSQGSWNGCRGTQALDHDSRAWLFQEAGL